MRGKTSQVGDTRVAPNGYHYTRTESGWRLTHHIIAEKVLGRPLREDERTQFVDGKKTNLDPDNIRVIKSGKGSLRAKKARLEVRIKELQAELALVEQELQA